MAARNRRPLAHSNSSGRGKDLRFEPEAEHIA
jgi:hypothetical protein